MRSFASSANATSKIQRAEDLAAIITMVSAVKHCPVSPAVNDLTATGDRDTTLPEGTQRRISGDTGQCFTGGKPMVIMAARSSARWSCWWHGARGKGAASSRLMPVRRRSRDERVRPLVFPRHTRLAWASSEFSTSPSTNTSPGGTYQGRRTRCADRSAAWPQTVVLIFVEMK